MIKDDLIVEAWKLGYACIKKEELTEKNNLIKKQQAELEKKDKMIDFMVGYIAKEVMERGEWTNLKNILIEYFERKIEI